MAKRKMSTFERLQAGRMNRAQRRELGRRVAAGDPKLAIVNTNAGGIDVGNESHFVAVPPDRDENPVREFGCWTQALKGDGGMAEVAPDRHSGGAGDRGLLDRTL